MAAAMLEGYSQSLEAGGKPFVLEESHPALRDMAMGAERDPVPFWSKLAKLPAANPPKRIKRLLEGELPDDAATSSLSRASPEWAASAARVTWPSAPPTVASPRARRRHGYRRPGAGRWGRSRTAPMPCA